MQKEHLISSVQWYQEILEVQEELIDETGNHVKRVGEYSYLIATDLGLNLEEARMLRVASTMHDIGKIGIPTSILSKPGKLTSSEYEIMKWHTTIGYGQLKDSTCQTLQTAAIVAHEHHEKWNGTGYPRGLKGEEIHLFGRIAAIADVFDALSSRRKYKNAWELDRILRLIAEERGQHFDPQIVDVFMNHLPAILQIQDQYKDESCQGLLA